jgi:hypothetical protein
MKVLNQRFEEDLSPGQGDVRAFETRQRCGACGHPGRTKRLNVIDQTKPAGAEKPGAEKNAAYSWGLGSHDDLGFNR